MIKAVFKSGALQIIGFGAGFCVHIFLARILGSAEYGALNFIYALSAVLAMIAMFGLPQACVRLIQEYTVKNKAATMKGLLVFAQLWPLAAGLVLSGIAYGGLWALGQFSAPMLLIAGGALVPLIALLRVQSGILRGFQRAALSVFYEVTYREVAFLTALLLVFVSSAFALSSVSALWALVGVFMGGIVLAGIAILKIITQKAPDLRAVYTPHYWLSLSWPMMMAVAMRMLMLRTDVITLGFMVSATSLGVYAGAAKLSMLMALAQMAVMPFFMPQAAKLFQNGKMQELRRLFYKAQKLQALGGAALLIVLIIFGKLLLSILGAEYVAGYNVFVILVIGQFISVVSGPASALLEMSAHEKTAMKIVMACAGLNLVLTPVLIFWVGIEGAAIATAIAFSAQNLAAYGVARQKGLIGGKAHATGT